MPWNAIATGLADYVLPVGTIPEMLITYWRRVTQLEISSDAANRAIEEATLREVMSILRVRTNHDFSKYKRPTIMRRIGRRMPVTGVSDLGTYLEVLRSRPEEVQALLRDLLISVTNFFRDQEAWTALEAIIPRLFEGKLPSDQVRVWVAACATGEEAYTVAMLLQEYAQTLDHPPAIQVFATDIDDVSVRQPRHGSYPETIVGDVKPERLRRFFVLEQGRYRVKAELRDPVLFAHHNVLRDPPFSKLDLITCRNLLIYLNREAQEQVIRLFHFSLRPGGHLLLGSAESLDDMSQLFAVVAKTQRLFQQRPNPAFLPTPMPARSSSAIPPGDASPTPKRDRGHGAVGELHQRLALRHMPPRLIVDEGYEIVHLSRGVGRFLLQDEGELSMNVVRAVHPDLRQALRMALFRATQQGARAEQTQVRFTGDATLRLVDLVVEPIQDADWPPDTCS